MAGHLKRKNKKLTKREGSTVSRKIKKLKKEGSTQKQAVGEALGRARQARKKKKKKK